MMSKKSLDLMKRQLEGERLDGAKKKGEIRYHMNLSKKPDKKTRKALKELITVASKVASDIHNAPKN